MVPDPGADCPLACVESVEMTAERAFSCSPTPVNPSKALLPTQENPQAVPGWPAKPLDGEPLQALAAAFAVVWSKGWIVAAVYGASCVVALRDRMRKLL